MRFNLFVIILVVATSCAPMYVPSVRNTPLFRGAGEFQGSAYLTTGVAVQGAYALTDNLGIIGSYSFLSENAKDPQNTSENYTRKNKHFEGGLGYFNATRSRRIELYVGYGSGESTTNGQYSFFFPTFGQQELIVTGKFRRYFIQPSIGTNNRGFNLAFTPRFSMVDFYEFTSGVVTEKPGEKLQLYIEPAATAKFRLGENLDGIFQLGLNVPIPNDSFFDYVPVQAAIGIQLHLGGSLRTRVY